jgi:oxaloacetate decarboxylase alpha subunit
LHTLTAELQALVKEHGVKLSADSVDDVLTYALFPQVGLKFLQNRGDASAFEPEPSAADAATAAAPSVEPAVANYSVAVDGQVYQVQIAAGETQISAAPLPPASASSSGAAEPLQAGLAGTVNKVLVAPGDRVAAGQTVIILEAMKMETEVSAATAGTVGEVLVRQGDSVAVGQNLLTVVGS